MVKNDHFGCFQLFFDVFSGLSVRIDLIPAASCQASSGTSLEYPHGILWENLKITKFGHSAQATREVISKLHQSMPCWYSKLVPEVAWPDAKGIRSI